MIDPGMSPREEGRCYIWGEKTHTHTTADAVSFRQGQLSLGPTPHRTLTLETLRDEEEEELLT